MRLAHLIAVGDDAGLRRQLLVTVVPVSAAVVVLVVGGLVGPPRQTLFWALTLLDYGGIRVTGTSG